MFEMPRHTQVSRPVHCQIESASSTPRRGRQGRAPWQSDNGAPCRAVSAVLDVERSLATVCAEVDLLNGNDRAVAGRGERDERAVAAGRTAAEPDALRRRNGDAVVAQVRLERRPDDADFGVAGLAPGAEAVEFLL